MHRLDLGCPDAISRTRSPESFAQELIAWQRLHGRHSLPWQNTRDPYRVWLSEIMLQQRDATSAATLLSGSDSLWVAPLEARASGFIDLSTDVQPLPVHTALDELVVGSWVALMAEGSWTRTRLSWTSPNTTLLLFTDALGYMQSLTRQSCEQLFASGQLQVISVHPVEDALDAVAAAAMRNSVDIRF